MSFGTLLSPKRRPDGRTIALHWIDYQQKSITAVLTLHVSFEGNTQTCASDILYDIKSGWDVFKNQKIIVRLSHKDRLKGSPNPRIKLCRTGRPCVESAVLGKNCTEKK
jgi:hypothetical protein